MAEIRRDMSATRLLLASSNAGKLRELKALFAGLELELLTPAQLGLRVRVEETGLDYSENASLKARAFARASGLWALGDDTGLEVDALGGAPGLRSSRLVGEGDGDAARRTRLLELLAPHPRPWLARFRACLALSDPAGTVDLGRGECPGEIVPEPHGVGGFGYDQVFQVSGMDKTMAELSLEEKNQISHRAMAARALLPVLRQRLGLPPRAPE
jgi:XTP/dITP diphosphohydrolase